MPTTSPDSIYYADGTTPASIATITAAMATSVQNALNVRETKSYVWPDQAARDAQTGMVNGQIGFQTDDETYYIYSGSWLIWAKAPAAYTPSFTGFTASSSSFIFSIAGGVVFVQGTATLNSAVSALMKITTPTGYDINLSYVDASRAAAIGFGGADDASTSNDYPLTISVDSALTVSINATNTAGTYAAYASTAAAVPFTWASSDNIYVTFSYPVA